MEIHPDHGWETVGQGAHPEEEREEGSRAWVGGVPRPPPLRPRRPPPPLDPGGGAPTREAGSETEDGGGAVTSARDVEDEVVVETGVWWPQVSSSRVRVSRTCKKVGGGCWCVRSVRTAS
jgi:hypothetical protein